MNVSYLPVRRLIVFAVLGLADFGLTRYLLQHESGSIYEGNPIANWCLTEYGWPGMAALKLATMLLAGSLGLIVFLRSPRAGERFMTLACFLVGVVVLYSCYLVTLVGRGPESLADPDVAQALEKARTMNAGFDSGARYRAVLDEVSEELLSAQGTLGGGVGRLAATDKANDPEWQTTLRSLYPGPSHEACLATNIVHYMLGRRWGRDLPSDLVPRLQTEYRVLYGAELHLPRFVNPGDDSLEEGEMSKRPRIFPRPRKIRPRRM